MSNPYETWRILALNSLVGFKNQCTNLSGGWLICLIRLGAVALSDLLGFLGNQPFGIVCIVYFHQQPLFHLEGPNIFHQTMVLGWSSWGRLYCPTPGFPWKITPGDVILTFPMFFFGSLFPYILPFEVINMCGGLGLGGFVLVGHLLVIASVSLGVAHAEIWLNHDHGY